MSKTKFLYEERPYIYVGSGILAATYSKQFSSHSLISHKLCFYSGLLLISVGILLITIRLIHRRKGEKLNKKHDQLTKQHGQHAKELEDISKRIN